MRSPFSLPLIIVFVGLVQVLVQIGALSIAFENHQGQSLGFHSQLQDRKVRVA